MEDLREIVEACVSGDSRAQEQLYRRMAPKMYGVCLRYAKDATEAEDNLQEGFLKVFANLSRFRHQGSFEGWVRRIMVNVSIEYYRKRKQLLAVEDMSRYDVTAQPNEALVNLTAEELTRIIQELPPRYRMIFNLYVMEGYNHQEISEMLDISVGASKSGLSRAREILRRKLYDINEREEVKVTRYE